QFLFWADSNYRPVHSPGSAATPRHRFRTPGGSPMKLNRLIAIAVGACLGLPVSGLHSVVQGQEPAQIEVWTPLPVKPNPFVPPHKPWTKLSELLAKHKGRQNWSELIVDDNLFHGEYISMAPGAKTPRRFHQDNRAFWIVQDGQIRI